MLAQQQRLLHLPIRIRQMPMCLTRRVTALGRRTIPKPQAYVKRGLADLQACAIPPQTRISQALPTRQARTRTRDEDSSGTLMAESRPGILSRKCIQTRATILKQKSLEQVQETDNARLRHQRHHIHRLQPGLRTHLQLRRQSRLLLLGMQQTTSKAEAKRALT